MQSLRILVIGFFLVLSSVAASVEPLNINTADAAQLAEGLKGIGPQKAVAIVRYREKHGPYKNVTDLTNVKGIGDKVVADNKGRIVARAAVPKSR